LQELILAACVVMPEIKYLCEIVAATGAEACRTEERETWFIFGT